MNFLSSHHIFTCLQASRRGMARRNTKTKNLHSARFKVKLTQRHTVTVPLSSLHAMNKEVMTSVCIHVSRHNLMHIMRVSRELTKLSGVLKSYKVTS